LAWRQEDARSKPPAELGITDQLLVGEGDLGRLDDRGITELFGRFLRAKMRDRGLAEELSLQPRENRKAAMARLRGKWASFDADRLKQEYFKVVQQSLVRYQSEARTKKPLQVGFAVRLVRDAGPISEMSVKELGGLYDSYLNAQKCDAALQYPSLLPSILR
jgi:hypothetical protein